MARHESAVVRGARIRAHHILQDARSENLEKKRAAIDLLRRHPNLADKSPESLMAGEVRVKLKHAQHVVAVDAGYASWEDLIVHARAATAAGPGGAGGFDAGYLIANARELGISLGKLETALADEPSKYAPLIRGEVDLRAMMRDGSWDLRVYEGDSLVLEGSLTDERRDILLAAGLIEKCTADGCGPECRMYFNVDSVPLRHIRLALGFAAAVEAANAERDGGKPKMNFPGDAALEYVCWLALERPVEEIAKDGWIVARVEPQNSDSLYDAKFEDHLKGTVGLALDDDARTFLKNATCAIVRQFEDEEAKVYCFEDAGYMRQLWNDVREWPYAALTGPEWLEEHFEYEYCDECGGDAVDHDAVPLMGWFARCKHPFPEGLSEEEAEAEMERRLERKNAGLPLVEEHA